MSQNIWDTINPATTSGNQLAVLLNDFKGAVVSGFSGVARPAQTKNGGYWIDNSLEETQDILKYMFYDGVQDILVFTINKATAKAVMGSSEALFEIIKTSDDSVGPILKLLKKRLAVGQTLTNDILGEINFTGWTDANLEKTQARIQSASLDNVTSTTHGADLIFSSTLVGSPTLIEGMRLKGNKRLGVGESAPGKTIHTKGTDLNSGIKAEIVEDSVNPVKMSMKKTRVIGSGQVLLDDNIGTLEFLSTDQNGVEVDVAKIECFASENTTDIASGANLIISTKKDGTNVYQEAIRIEDGKVSILGASVGENIKVSTALLDDQAIRSLMSIDGSIYGSFEATFRIYGYDSGVDVRAARFSIHGIYNDILNEWYLNYSESITKGADSIVALDIPAENVQNLVINYINQLAFATYVGGQIYGEIRRVVR